MNFLGLGFLACADGEDFAFLARFGVGLLTLKLKHCFDRFNILFLDSELFVAFKNIGADVLRRGQLSDLANAFDVFEHIAVQIIADDLDDLFAKLLAVFKQLHELNLFADGFQGFGELSSEQKVDRGSIGRALSTDRLRNFKHILGCLVDPQVERNRDVGTHIVATNQAVFTTPIDF